MNISFAILNVKPCSINKGYYKHNRALSLEGRRYRKRLLCSINRCPSIREALQTFTGHFNYEEHSISVRYSFLVPKEQLFVRGVGALSRLGGDVDNLIKLTTDFLFNPKHCLEPFKGAAGVIRPFVNVSIDDQFIQNISANKLPSPDGQWGIVVYLDIVNKLHDSPDFPPLISEYAPV